MSHTLVLIRDGESEWNKANLFTGWTDVDLSAEGKEEAYRAARDIKEAGIVFDTAYTSYLKRAIHTLNIVLEQVDEEYIPVIKSWKLNERHYGLLQGLNKKDIAARYGEETLMVWRRSYDVCPPELDEADDRNPANQTPYRSIDPSLLPLSESLKTTIERVVPYYEEVIKRDLSEGKTVLVAAHGNTLRALIKHLESISEEEISSFNIPTATPVVYELDENLKPISRRYLGDPELIAAKMDAMKKLGRL